MEANKTPLLEVLNNLASIHHEVRNDQTQLLDIEKLGKLKLLAAQLYMEVDIELLSMEFPELQVADSEIVLETESEIVLELDSEMDSESSSGTVIDAVFEPASDLVIDMFSPEVEIANIELPFAEIAKELEVADEILASPEQVPVAVIEPIAIATSEPMKEPEPEPVAVPVASPIEVPAIEPSPIPAVAIDSSDKVSSLHTVAGIIGQFPLSRRFEFSNILFGGDMDNMGLFVQEIIDAPTAAARGDVYDRWYEQKQWRRRDESASDMWRMIKRIFTQ